MKPFLFISLLFVVTNGYAQLSDSIRNVIKEGCFERLDKDQMKQAPGYFKNPTDSLTLLREQYFIDNFHWLIATTKQYGFPCKNYFGHQMILRGNPVLDNGRFSRL